MEKDGVDGRWTVVGVGQNENEERKKEGVGNERRAGESADEGEGWRRWKQTGRTESVTYAGDKTA